MEVITSYQRRWVLQPVPDTIETFLFKANYESFQKYRDLNYIYQDQTEHRVMLYRRIFQNVTQNVTQRP